MIDNIASKVSTNKNYNIRYFDLLYKQLLCLIRENFEEGELLEPQNDDTDFVSKYFNASNDIKAITHGWMSKESTDWIQNMKKAFLNMYDINVITVDWSELADNPVYPWSAFSTRYVGKYLARVINSLRKSYGADNGTVHLIGHSLGAQIMGYAGMYSDGTIDRITGESLDLPLLSKLLRSILCTF